MRYRLQEVLLKQSKKEELMNRLVLIVKAFDDGSYFGLNPRQLKLAKQEILKKIHSA
jgi:hypothetical protein